VTDDEFQGKVLRQLAAIVARLDEQDSAQDRLTEKVDRLTVKVDYLSNQVASNAAAVEQALNSITTLSRRVVRLEHPNGEI